MFYSSIYFPYLLLLHLSQGFRQNIPSITASHEKLRLLKPEFDLICKFLERNKSTKRIKVNKSKNGEEKGRDKNKDPSSGTTVKTKDKVLILSTECFLSE